MTQQFMPPPGLDPASELPNSVQILDNQPLPKVLFSYPAATYPFSFFMFSIERNNGRRIALHKDVNDGTNISGGFDQNNVGPDVGVTITHSVAGGIVTHYYTSTATGNNGIFKWKKIEAWA